MRAPWPLVVALLAASVLAACATVPTSGPIEEGPIIEPSQHRQFVRVIAAPPSPGADPEEIVRGFLDASASLEQDHGIARRYLTAAADAAWRADSGTTIYDEGSLRVSATRSRVVVTMDVTATLGGDGSLEPIDPPSRRALDFRVIRVGRSPTVGPEWRISDPPDGIFLSDADLNRAFRVHYVYFNSARADVLVPDSRLLPVVGPSLPSALAQMALAGPSDWLAPSVRGVAPGSALALGSVADVNGVARVELTQGALAATDDQRRDLASSLTWTLTQLPGVSAVRLLVGGEAYPVPGAPPEMDRATWRSRAPDAMSLGASGADPPSRYALAHSSVTRLDGEDQTSIPVPESARRAPGELAVSLDERWAAVASSDQRDLVTFSLPDAGTSHRIVGQRVASPSFDVDGQLWFVDSGRIHRSGVDGPARSVPMRSGRAVSVISLARDGARIALISKGELLLGLLVRGKEGLKVANVRKLAGEVTSARDIAWQDATTLVVLASDGGGGAQALRVVLGSGQVQRLGAPALPAQIAAAPQSTTLLVTEGGGLFANVGPQWRKASTSRSVAYPG